MTRVQNPGATGPPVLIPSASEADGEVATVFFYSLMSLHSGTCGGLATAPTDVGRLEVVGIVGKVDGQTESNINESIYFYSSSI